MNIVRNYKITRYLLVIILLGIPFLFFEKGTVVICINNFRIPFLDLVFKNLTHLGLSYVYLIPVLYYGHKKHKSTAKLFLYSFLIHAVIVTLFKQVIFRWVHRPVAHLTEKGISLDLIKEIDYPSWNSFPSGHTATSFSIIVLYILITKSNHMIKWLFLAVLVGFSRMYLLQHFFIDVYFGMLIGVITTYVVYFSLNLSKKYNS